MDPVPRQRCPHRLAADPVVRQPFDVGGFGGQIERPETGRVTEVARTAMQELFEPTRLGCGERRVDGSGPGGAGRERGRAPLGEGPDRVAHGLLVAADGARDGGRMLAAGAGQHNLGTTQGEGV